MSLHRLLLGMLLAAFATGAIASSGGSFFDSSVTLSANDSGGIPVNGRATLTATVKNLGAGGGTDSLSIDVPNYFTVTGEDCGASITPQGDFTLVYWNAFTLTGGQTRVCNVSIRLDALPPAGTASNAFATLANGGSNTDNNSAVRALAIQRTPVSDLKALFEPASATAAVGATVTTRLTVGNDGPTNASSVIARVTTPAGLSLDRIFCVSGQQANPFTWSVGSLNAIAIKTCDLTFTVLAATPSPNSVTAAVSSTAVIDPNTANNAASFAVTIGAANPSGVKLDIDASKPGPVKIGDTYNYTLTVRNNGDAVIGSGRVTNPLPSQLAFVSANCGTYAQAGFVWTLPAIQAGAAASCVFTVRVNSLPANGVLHDTASATLSLATGANAVANATQDIGTVRPAAPAARTVSGAPTTQDSGRPSLSADGKLVAFSSKDSGYLNNDQNATGPDVYLLDRRSGALKLVSVNSAGAQLVGASDNPVVSGNGQSVAFLYNPGASVTGGLGSGQAGLVTATSTTICVSPPNGLFKPTCLTGTNGQPINGSAEGASLSSDGRYMAFCTAATNIPGTTDTNGLKDVYVLDQTLGQVKLVSTATNGTQGNGDSCAAMISGDGKSVVFESRAVNLGADGVSAQVFKKDMATNTLTLISKGLDGNRSNTGSGQATISYDGQRITFASRASNLSPGVPTTARNVWVYDGSGAITTANKIDVVRGAGGALPNLDSEFPKISCNGRVVAFTTLANNLAPPDTNNKADVYLYDVDNRIVRRAVAPQAGVEPNGTTQEAVLDCEGNTMAVTTTSTNLNPGDPNGNGDVYGQDSPLRTDAAASNVDASFSGNWYNPGNDGHGFLLEALNLPGNPFYVTWYVFQNGQPVFLQGVAAPVGNTLSVDMTTAKSTGFPVGAGGATSTPWGKVKLTFTDASNGLAEWTPTAAGFTAGSFTVRRLTTPALIQSDTGALKACYSGIWSDPAKPGYGLDLEVNDYDAATRLVTVYWYTYRSNGSPLWLVGTGGLSAGKVALDLYQVTGAGAQFPPNYAKPGTTPVKWGSATLQFTGNDALSFAWTPTVTGYSPGTGNLKRLTALATRTCQ